MFDIAEYDNLSDLMSKESRKLMRESLDDYKATKDISLVTKKSQENFNKLWDFCYDFLSYSMSKEDFKRDGLELIKNEIMRPLIDWPDFNELLSGEYYESREFTYEFLNEMTSLHHGFASVVKLLSQSYFQIRQNKKGLFSPNDALIELYQFVLIHEGLKDN
jgi:hypothetical protein